MMTKTDAALDDLDAEDNPVDQDLEDDAGSMEAESAKIIKDDLPEDDGEMAAAEMGDDDGDAEAVMEAEPVDELTDDDADGFEEEEDIVLEADDAELEDDADEPEDEDTTVLEADDADFDEDADELDEEGVEVLEAEGEQHSHEDDANTEIAMDADADDEDGFPADDLDDEDGEDALALEAEDGEVDEEETAEAPEDDEGEQPPMVAAMPGGFELEGDDPVPSSEVTPPDSIINSPEHHVRMVEAILFASAEPVGEAELAERLPKDVMVGPIVDQLQAVYGTRGVHLVQIGGKWAFRTAPDLSFLLEKERVEPKKLSRAAIETLAIIAYHQPVTRSEIEELRGVSVSKGTLDVLLDIGWAAMRGRRQAPGRPVTYGTTPAFLEHFGLAGVGDLPGLEELKAAGLLDSRLPPEFNVPTPITEGLGEGDGDFDEESPELAFDDEASEAEGDVEADVDAEPVDASNDDETGETFADTDDEDGEEAEYSGGPLAEASMAEGNEAILEHIAQAMMEDDDLDEDDGSDALHAEAEEDGDPSEEGVADEEPKTSVL